MRNATLRRLADEVYVGAFLVSGAALIGAALWGVIWYALPFVLWIGFTD